MTSKPYNGYKNWTHWNVSLWINNDEGLYLHAQELLRGDKLPRKAAAGAVVGAVLMAVVSALVLDQSADRGALALGALSGAAGGAGSATVNQESIIKNCMLGRGYKVLR